MTLNGLWRKIDNFPENDGYPRYSYVQNNIIASDQDNFSLLQELRTLKEQPKCSKLGCSVKTDNLPEKVELKNIFFTYYSILEYLFK